MKISATGMCGGKEKVPLETHHHSQKKCTGNEKDYVTSVGIGRCVISFGCYLASFPLHTGSDHSMP